MKTIMIAFVMLILLVAAIAVSANQSQSQVVGVTSDMVAFDNSMRVCSGQSCSAEEIVSRANARVSHQLSDTEMQYLSRTYGHDEETFRMAIELTMFDVIHARGPGWSGRQIALAYQIFTNEGKRLVALTDEILKCIPQPQQPCQPQYQPAPASAPNVTVNNYISTGAAPAQPVQTKSWRLSPSRTAYYEPGWFSAGVSAVFTPFAKGTTINNQNSANGGSGGSACAEGGDSINNNAVSATSTHVTGVNVGEGSVDASGTGSSTAGSGNN